MAGDGTKTFVGTLVGESLNEVRRRSVSSDTTKDDAAKEGRSSETVGTVDTAGNLT